MLKRSFCGAAIVLLLSAPAVADRRPVPTLSGTYGLSSNSICYAPGGTSPNFQQEVGVETFGRRGRSRTAQNTLVPGAPVQFQEAIGHSEHFEIINPHKMILGSAEVYVQFGAVVNGIATSAYILGHNSDGSCSFQITFTRTGA